MIRARAVTLLGGAVGGVLMLGLLAAPSAAAPADNRIAQRVDAAVRAPALGTDVTVHVRHVRTDATVAQRRSRELQVPASTMKVVTAATALATLGESHRFVTRVVAGARADRIVLVGGGDPLLSRAHLGDLAKRTARQLAKSGVRSVTVDVDDYLFPQPSDAAGWMPGDRPTYAAAVRPLGLLGEYSNDTVTTAWAAFIQALRARGIEVRTGTRVLAPAGAQRIAAIRPNTVRRAVDVMLRISENNVAEVLFRQVARARGYPATWSASSSAAGEVLRELGLDTWRLRLVDGSGLSFDNRLSAAALTQLLDLALEDRRLTALIDGLPIAGQSGTLIRRFAAPPASCARGQVAAKTGSLTGVSTLAGVTRGSDGQWRSFAILVNKRPAGFPTTSTSLAIDTVAAVVRGCA